MEVDTVVDKRYCMVKLLKEAFEIKNKWLGLCCVEIVEVIRLKVNGKVVFRHDYECSKCKDKEICKMSMSLNYLK